VVLLLKIETKDTLVSIEDISGVLDQLGFDEA
jgi:hypothetical protein